MAVRAIDDTITKFLWGPDPGPSRVRCLWVELYFCRHLRCSSCLPIELLLASDALVFTFNAVIVVRVKGWRLFFGPPIHMFCIAHSISKWVLHPAEITYLSVFLCLPISSGNQNVLEEEFWWDFQKRQLCAREGTLASRKRTNSHSLWRMMKVWGQCSVEVVCISSEGLLRARLEKLKPERPRTGWGSWGTRQRTPSSPARGVWKAL